MSGTDQMSPIDRVIRMFLDVRPVGGGASLEQMRGGLEAVMAQLPIRDGASVVADTLGGVEGYWVRAAGASSDRVGVMLHGGGFVLGSAKGYRAFASEVSHVTQSRIFVPEYRLAPEHPFPAANVDASAAINAAVAEVGPANCFVVGDSAGGGLAVTGIWELQRQGKPLPACVVLISALVDLTVTNPSFVDLASVDPICAQPGTRRNVGWYLDGRGPEQVPEAFPMLADLGWFPPSLVLSGGREVLRDDSRNLARKLSQEGVHVVHSEYDGMVHVWPLFAEILPEARQALDEIGAFVSAQCTVAV